MCNRISCTALSGERLSAWHIQKSGFGPGLTLGVCWPDGVVDGIAKWNWVSRTALRKRIAPTGMQCAPSAGQFHAAVLTVCRA